MQGSQAGHDVTSNQAQDQVCLQQVTRSLSKHHRHFNKRFVKARYFYDDFKPAQVDDFRGSPMVLGRVAATNDEDKMSFTALGHHPATNQKHPAAETSAQYCTKRDPDNVLEPEMKRMRKPRSFIREGFGHIRSKDCPNSVSSSSLLFTFSYTWKEDRIMYLERRMDWQA